MGSNRIRLVVLAAFGAILALAVVSTGASQGLAVGDYWLYAYDQRDPGVTWTGTLTERYAGTTQPDGFLMFEVFGGGTLSGNLSGTWNLYEANRYRNTDGAFARSNSTEVLFFTQSNVTYHLVRESQITNDPPLALGGSLIVNSETSATTTRTETVVTTVNGTSSGPATQTTVITFTQRIEALTAVTVPAGTFSVWRISLFRSDIGGRLVYFYNETVGNSVRSEVLDDFGQIVASLSLVEYGAGPPAPVVSFGLAGVGPPLGVVAATAVVVGVIVLWDRRRRPAAPAGPASPPLSPPTGP